MNAVNRKSLRFWLITAAAIASAALTFGLGRWQLDRAHQKQSLFAAVEERMARPALDDKTLNGTRADPDLIHRRISLRGQWIGERTIFLDNRPMGGKTGFWVMTPLRLEANGQVVLVQRGWVQRNFVDRTQLPPLVTPAGLVEIQGRLAPPPSKLYEFKGTESGPIRQNLDLGAYGAEIGLALWPQTVIQNGPASEGLLREWAAVDAGVDKHYGYAFQWFGLCGLITMLYVWFQIVRPRRSN